VCAAVIPTRDKDGVADRTDECPEEMTETETGILNCRDLCPSDSANKSEPGVCRCGGSDMDTNNDQVADCMDQCWNDMKKIEPGVCGCGIDDKDMDMDGTMDCQDECAHDTDKTVAGVCGCNKANTDTDQDGVADCIDECPRLWLVVRL